MSWIKSLFHPIPVFPSYCICIGFADKTVPKIGVPFNYFKNINGHMYIHEETHKRFSEYLETRIGEDESYPEQLLEEVYTESKKLIEITKKISQDSLKTKSRLELIMELEEFVEAFKNLTPYLPTINICIAIFETMLRNELGRRIDNPKLIDDYILILTSPKNYTVVGDFYDNILKLAIEVNKDEKIKRSLLESHNLTSFEKFLLKSNSKVFNKIKRITKEFSWMNLDFGFGKFLTFEDTLKRIKWQLRSDPEMKLKQLRRSKAKRQRKRQQILNHYLSGKIAKFAEFMNSLVSARQDRFEAFNIAGARVRSFLEEIATCLGLTFDEISYLTPVEIVDALRDSQPINGRLKELVAERKNGYAMVMEKGEIKLYSGKQIELVLEEEVTPLVSEVRGIMIASKGVNIMGRACIVFNENDFSKVKERDVLIVVATSPAYTVILDKVVAIVADVGSITSHTALVVREMGIPCLTKTRFGTRVFHDGDMLEIDAERGIARKL